MTRYDAVNYISHGIAKRAGLSDARPARGVEQDQQSGEGEQRREARRSRTAMRSMPIASISTSKAADGKIDPLIGRETGGQPHDPDPLPPAEEQSAVRRRSGRRQDGDRRGPGAAHRQWRSARSAEGLHDLPARHGRAARRHALSRRFRRAAQGGDQGDRAPAGRHHVHRRDPHGDRRGRHERRRDGCLEPAEAGARRRQSALHRLDHLQGISPAFREGPGAGAALPEDRRQRAVDPGCDQDPEGPEALFRGVPQGPLHRRCDRDGRAAVGALHERPQAARQGDRRDRRDRRLADAAAREQAQAR